MLTLNQYYRRIIMSFCRVNDDGEVFMNATEMMKSFPEKRMNISQEIRLL